MENEASIAAAEVAWYYYRDKIEDVLGVSRGTLDTPEPEG